MEVKPPPIRTHEKNTKILKSKQHANARNANYNGDMDWLLRNNIDGMNSRSGKRCMGKKKKKSNNARAQHISNMR